MAMCILKCAIAIRKECGKGLCYPVSTLIAANVRFWSIQSRFASARYISEAVSSLCGWLLKCMDNMVIGKTKQLNCKLHKKSLSLG